MAKRTYVAEIERGSDGTLGVVFPDLPGCVSVGSDIESAMRNAEEALTLHLEGMAEDNEAFPEPTSIDVLTRDENGQQKPGFFAVVSAEAPDASERVNVYLPKSLLERVDRYTASSGLNRSSFFGLAAKRLLDAELAKGPSAWASYVTHSTDAELAALADLISEIGMRISEKTIPASSMRTWMNVVGQGAARPFQASAHGLVGAIRENAERPSKPTAER